MVKTACVECGAPVDAEAPCLECGNCGTKQAPVDGAMTVVDEMPYDEYLGG